MTDYKEVRYGKLEVFRGKTGAVTYGITGLEVNFSVSISEDPLTHLYYEVTNPEWNNLFYYYSERNRDVSLDTIYDLTAEHILKQKWSAEQNDR